MTQIRSPTSLPGRPPHATAAHHEREKRNGQRDGIEAGRRLSRAVAGGLRHRQADVRQRGRVCTAGNRGWGHTEALHKCRPAGSGAIAESSGGCVGDSRIHTRVAGAGEVPDAGSHRRAERKLAQYVARHSRVSAAGKTFEDQWGGLWQAVPRSAAEGAFSQTGTSGTCRRSRWCFRWHG